MTEIIKKRALGEAEIRNHEIKPYNQQTEGPTLQTLDLTEAFHGDIEGENMARSLCAVGPDGSSSLVGFSRVVGKIGDKSGSFVLQASANLSSNKAQGKWFVLPGSGTGELRGLQGEGGFSTILGQPAEIWLDYWFE